MLAAVILLYNERGDGMNKQLKAVLAFFALLVVGILYVAVMDEGFLSFNENSGVIHAILYSTAAICATLIWLNKKE